MPKKLFKRLSPSPEFIQRHPSLKAFSFILEDPNLFHLTRYSVSMAFLVGVFLAFFPIPGQMVLAAIVAFWLRCNLPITIALVWITNPITIPFIFFATYQLGTWLLETPTIIAMPDQITLEWMGYKLGKIWKPLLIGSLCAGSFFSILSYTIIKVAWRWRIGYLWTQRTKKRNKGQS